MRSYYFLPLLITTMLTIITACNNDTADSVEKADSINKERRDSTPSGIITTDSVSSSFLVKAANGGIFEIEMGELAREKGLHREVKDFATMMVQDHSDANEKIKALAAKKNVILPSGISEEQTRIKNDISGKNGNEFDHAYITLMVQDHEKDIKEFEEASRSVTDSEIKVFIDNILPTLRNHLDSSKKVQAVLGR